MSHPEHSYDDLDKIATVATAISGLSIGTAYIAEAANESVLKYALAGISGASFTLAAWRILKEPDSSYIPTSEDQ